MAVFHMCFRRYLELGKQWGSNIHFQNDFYFIFNEFLISMNLKNCSIINFWDCSFFV